MWRILVYPLLRNPMQSFSKKRPCLPVHSSIDKFESKICNAKTVLSGVACLSHKVVCSCGSDIFKEFDSYETASYVFTL